jgi:hypothetical protein
VNKWLKWRLQDAASDGDAGGGSAGASGDAGAGAGAGASGDPGEGGKGKGADAGAGAEPKDWQKAIAGDDKELLEAIKGIEDPKALIESHKATTAWREAIAGDNKEALKTLQRFTSPKALWDSYAELRGRMAKGELKANTAFPDKGTAEEQAAWRAENGIPAEPGKYEIKLPKGVELTEADQPMIDGFQKFAFEKNLPAGAVNDVVNWYLAGQAEQQQQAQERFEAAKTETASTLAEEWGGEYKANLNKIQGVIDATIPAEDKDLKGLIQKALATNPAFARHYAAIALQLNPAGTLVPGDQGANEGALTDEIKKIEKVMRGNRAEYDKDAKMQERYRDLLGAYEKMTKKQWGQ